MHTLFTSKQPVSNTDVNTYATCLYPQRKQILLSRLEKTNDDNIFY